MHDTQSVLQHYPKESVADLHFEYLYVPKNVPHKSQPFGSWILWTDFRSALVIFFIFQYLSIIRTIFWLRDFHIKSFLDLLDKLRTKQVLFYDEALQSYDGVLQSLTLTNVRHRSIGRTKLLIDPSYKAPHTTCTRKSSPEHLYERLLSLAECV